MGTAITIGSFIFFTALVAVLTWWLTRGTTLDTDEGYFLAGRSLTGVFIAGSLLLTNLSTEQLVGLNAASFNDGLSVMCWEVIAGVSLVILALVFLPRYLKSGIATIPQFLEERYGTLVRTMTVMIFIVAYMLILLPFVLFLGANGLNGMLQLDARFGLSEIQTIWILIASIAGLGGAYAIFGGLRAIAVSDTFNGAGLLTGGLMITFFSLSIIAGDEGGFSGAFAKIQEADPDAFVSLGTANEDTHWPTLFTGVLLLNFFYWCTNQQIIQRTFGAKNLAEGQKGVLLAAFFKILAPLILVLPGIAAAYLVIGAADSQMVKSVGQDLDGNWVSSRAYGALVARVLPEWLLGFFAAVVVGSILSTFNSVLNSAATLFSLDVYKKYVRPDATTKQVVLSGQMCSLVIGILAIIAAPLIFYGRDGVFGFFQTLNGVDVHPHDMSHYITTKGEKLAASQKRDLTNSTLLAGLIDTLKATKEADGSSLFDNMALAYGSNIRSGHQLSNCPTLLTGRGAGLNLGENIVVPKDTPLCNAWLAMLNGVGVKADQHGDSTGVLKEIVA